MRAVYLKGTDVLKITNDAIMAEVNLDVESFSNTDTLDVDNAIALCDTSGGAFTINLPTASGITGKRYWIKLETGGSDLTIDPSGAETIDGLTTLDLVTVNDYVQLISDGTNWEILGSRIVEFITALSSVKTIGTSDDYPLMTGNSVTATVGQWNLRGMCCYQGSGDPAYGIIEAGWFSANGANSNTRPSDTFTGLTVNAGGGVEERSFNINQASFGAGRNGTVNNLGIYTVDLPTLRITITAAEEIFLVPHAIMTTAANSRVWTQIYLERISI